MSYNQIDLSLDRVNSTRIIEFQNPVTKVYADGYLVNGTTDKFAVTFTGIPPGVYTNLIGRLKGTSITATFTGSVTVTNPPGGTTKLDPPTGLSATALDATRIGFSWNPRANASGYRLRVNGGTLYMPGTDTSYILTGLAPGTTASGEIQALGAGSYSDSDYSAPKAATTTGGSTAPPVISSFSPTHAVPGIRVTVSGSGFTGMTQALIGPTNCPSFNVVSDASYQFLVPNAPSGTTGPLGATTAGGTGRSSAAFTVDAPATGGGAKPPTGKGFVTSPDYIEAGTPKYLSAGNWRADRNVTAVGRVQQFSPTAGDSKIIDIQLLQPGYVDFVSILDPSLGGISFQLDNNTPVSISQYAAAPTPPAVRYTTPLLPAGAYQIKLTVTGAGGVVNRLVVRHDGEAMFLSPLDLTFVKKSEFLVQDYNPPAPLRTLDFQGGTLPAGLTATFYPASGGASPVTPSLNGNGQLQLRNDASGVTEYLFSTGPVVPWWHIKALFPYRGNVIPNTASTTRFETFVGAISGPNRVGWVYNALTDKSRQEVYLNGQLYQAPEVGGLMPDPPGGTFTTGYLHGILTGTYMPLLLGGPTTPDKDAGVFNYDMTASQGVNLLDASLYDGYQFGVQFRTTSAGACEQSISLLQAGTWGTSATGDNSIYNDEYGNTVVENGKVRTNVTLRPISTGIAPPLYPLFHNFAQGTVSITAESFATTSPVVKLESIVFQQYQGDNNLYGDGAPYFLRDNSAGTDRSFGPHYGLYTQTESDNSIDAVRMMTGTTSERLIAPGVHLIRNCRVLAMDPTRPNTTTADGSVVRYNGRNYAGYCFRTGSPNVALDFGLSRSTGGPSDYENWEFVFKTTGRPNTKADYIEGVRPAAIDGRPYFFGSGIEELAVLDIETGYLLGYLPQPAEVKGQDYGSHGAIVSLEINGGRTYGLVTFRSNRQNDNSGKGDQAGPVTYGYNGIYVATQSTSGSN